jgi:hypothetical protein
VPEVVKAAAPKSPKNKLTRVRPAVGSVAPPTFPLGGEHAREYCVVHPHPPPGRPRLKALLCEVAQSIARTSDNDLAALDHRIARRRGKGRATLAVAHALLVILYHMLRDQKPYPDWGASYFDRWDTERLQRRHVQRLEPLGYTVTLTPIPAT